MCLWWEGRQQPPQTNSPYHEGAADSEDERSPEEEPGASNAGASTAGTLLPLQGNIVLRGAAFGNHQAAVLQGNLLTLHRMHKVPVRAGLSTCIPCAHCLSL